MIEISTPTTNSFQNDMVQKNIISDDLGEEEQSFYASLKKNLNALISSPDNDVIARILKYSKSL